MNIKENIARLNNGTYVFRVIQCNNVYDTPLNSDIEFAKKIFLEIAKYRNFDDIKIKKILSEFDSVIKDKPVILYTNQIDNPIRNKYDMSNYI